MDDAGIARMASVARPRELAPGEAIIKEGERSDMFFLITAGGVRVSINNEGSPKEVARLGPGAFFGEMAVLNDEPRTATVTAIGDVYCLEFVNSDVLGILQDYPKVKEVLGLVGLKRAEALLDAQIDSSS